MRTRFLAAACLALGLSACNGGDPVTVEAPIERATPASLLVPCAAPVALPARDLTVAEVEVMWGRDRSALRACGGQLEALAAIALER